MPSVIQLGRGSFSISVFTDRNRRCTAYVAYDLGGRSRDHHELMKTDDAFWKSSLDRRKYSK